MKHKTKVTVANTMLCAVVLIFALEFAATLVTGQPSIPIILVSVAALVGIRYLLESAISNNEVKP